MRPLILVLMMIVCTSSCDNATEKTPERTLSLEEQIALKKKSELASEISNDTVILDHVFGMSRKEMYRHKNKLFKKKKIYGIYKTKNTRIFAYDLKTKNFDKLTLYFDAYFHNDEMYRMECIPKLKNNEDLAEVQSDLIDFYEVKYGSPHFKIPQDTVTNNHSALWIHGNQEIIIERNDENVAVSYTDLKRQMKVVDDI